MPDNENKVQALKNIIYPLRKSGRENSALLYLQQGLLLGIQLKIVGEIKEVEDRMVPAYTGVKNSSTQIDLEELKTMLLQIKSRQDTLDFAVKEYTRRTMSFADDIKADNDEKVSGLSLQQKVLMQLAKERAANTKRAIAVGIVFTLLTALVFLQFYRRRQAKNKLELNQLQNKVLRSQLNPHFIFNALNSVRNYIQRQPEVAANYLSKFSTLMRQVLENSEEEKISLEDEIAMLENYMQLESLRMHQGFDYEIFLDQSVDAANTLVPPLILQPVLENAIWHGLDPMDNRGRIKLSFIERNDLLEAKIEDDGVGLKSASSNKIGGEKKRSLGLQITRDRIGLMNRKSKSKGWLSQQILERGASVLIVIPV